MFLEEWRMVSIAPGVATGGGQRGGKGSVTPPLQCLPWAAEVTKQAARTLVLDSTRTQAPKPKHALLSGLQGEIAIDQACI